METGKSKDTICYRFQCEHFGECHFADALAAHGLRAEARINGIDGVDVREVLVCVGPKRGCENGSGYVRSAARKRG